MNQFLTIAAFIFGACIGSFLNVVIWRLPREEKLTGRSHCPNCRHQLSSLNLIPLLSFVFQAGKCQYCGKKISPRYFAIELITGLLFALAFYFILPNDLYSSFVLAKTAFVIAVCIVVFAIDYDHYLILDKVVWPATVAMLIFNLALDLSGGSYSQTLNGFLSAIIAFAPFWALWKFSKGKWMGFGDAKLVLFMGLALGFPGIVIALFLAFTVGAVVGLSLMGIGAKQFNSRLPFGTFLTVATVITIFFGSSLWNIYWSLFT